MNVDDIKSLSEKTREDGKRLYGVCEFLYSAAMIGCVAFGFIGIIFTFLALDKLGGVWGLIIFFITLAICAATYIFAILSTHFGKVLVHISFSNVAVLEQLLKSD